MQQNALIRGRYSQRLTHLFCRPPLHVAQLDDLALRPRQCRDRVQDHHQHLFTLEALRRQSMPGRRRSGPEARAEELVGQVVGICTGTIILSRVAHGRKRDDL